jgi:hypothetical protein
MKCSVLNLEGRAAEEVSLFILQRRGMYSGIRPWDAASIARENDYIAKQNVGQVAAGLVAALFGGRVAHPFKKEVREFGEEGTPPQFRPDVSYDSGKGMVYTEVKASRQCNPRFAFSYKQIADYASLLLHRIQQRDALPQVNVAFLKYWIGCNDSLNSLTPGEVVRLLARNTRSLTILPLNLFFFAWMLGREEVRDHSNSTGGEEEARYRDIPKSLITTLNQIKDSELFGPDKVTFKEICEQYKFRLAQIYAQETSKKLPFCWLQYREAALQNATVYGQKHLCLDFLRTFSFPSFPRLSLSYRKRTYPVKPFRVKVYENGPNNEEYPAWLRTFERNHTEILAHLKIPYCPEEDRPF